MPNTQSAAKRMRQNEKRRERNRVFRGRARTYVNRTRQAIADGDVEAAQEFSLLAVKALDKAAQKGVIHQNNADRRKSRLMKQVSRLVSEQ